MVRGVYMAEINTPARAGLVGCVVTGSKYVKGIEVENRYYTKAEFARIANAFVTALGRIEAELSAVDGERGQAGQIGMALFPAGGIIHSAVVCGGGPVEFEKIEHVLTVAADSANRAAGRIERDRAKNLADTPAEEVLRAVRIELNGQKMQQMIEQAFERRIGRLAAGGIDPRRAWKIGTMLSERLGWSLRKKGSE